MQLVVTICSYCCCHYCCHCHCHYYYFLEFPYASGGVDTVLFFSHSLPPPTFLDQNKKEYKDRGRKGMEYENRGSRPVPREGSGGSNDPPKYFWKSIFSVTILFIELYLRSKK